MKRMFVFIGASGSGKTTLIAGLVEKYPNQFRRVVTCTSRRKRVGEIEGIDYHFRPDDYFVDNPNLVLVKKTDCGDFYGTRKEDLFSTTHHLLLASKPTGVSKLIELGLRDIVIVRIKISEMLKIERMRQRGDNEEMIRIRLESDPVVTGVDFKDLLVIDLEANQTLDEEIESVVKAC